MTEAGRRGQCPRVEDPSVIHSMYGRLLKDESNLKGGIPARIYFPENVADVRAAVREVRMMGGRITTSGARTGIVGGAVPFDGDNLLCLEKMKAGASLARTGDGSWAVSVSPSLTLQELASFLADGRNAAVAGSPYGLFYPVDPTETTASLGGNVSTNASGARSFLYGPTRNWVVGMTVVLADGSMARLARHGGRCGAPRRPLEKQSRGARPAKAAGSSPAAVIAIHRYMEEGAGEETTVRMPLVALPKAKHAAGYWMAPDMDALDLFIGAEGTLGIVASVDLALVEKPAVTVGLCAFLEDQAVFLEFLSRMKAAKRFSPAALEYMDGNSLRLLEEFRRESGAACGYPAFPTGKQGMVYVEADCAEPMSADAALEEMAGILEGLRIREDSTWAAADEEGLEAMRRLRHALPERVNAEIARRASAVDGISKLSTDLSVTEQSFEVMLEDYSRVMAEYGLPYVLFGHAGDCHLHLNILPATLEDMKRGREICLSLARRAVELGGSVSAEHGIGRLKKYLLPVQFGLEDLEAMRSIKEQLDPQGIFNPGVMW